MSKADQLMVEQIVSGGQTGVDRGALDAAIALGLRHGGWCPKGRLAEDGAIPLKYRLRETASREYPVRTERNVLDSDGTLILFRRKLQGGTELTFRLAQRYEKPHLLMDLAIDADSFRFRTWMVDLQIRTLNVAGPRESSAPGIADEARRFLEEALA